jgi:hypothetical protein
MILAAAIVLLGTASVAVHGSSILQEADLARNLISEGLWLRVVTALGASVTRHGDQLTSSLDAVALLKFVVPLALVAWIGGSFQIARCRSIPFTQALGLWGVAGWAWWLLAGTWEALDLIAALTGRPACVSLLRGTLPLWHGMLWAGWLTTGWSLARPNAPAQQLDRDARLPPLVWGAIVIYVVTFVAMNWGLYESLHLPHGDSAMYEEHLWNLLHGKGFRSYLDNNLFLGEHIQVIHILLVPLYLLWPSQLLLELCQSVALAAGAIPVFRIAFRHSGSRRAATSLAIAYLLYVRTLLKYHCSCSHLTLWNRGVCAGSLQHWF